MTSARHQLDDVTIETVTILGLLRRELALTRADMDGPEFAAHLLAQMRTVRAEILTVRQEIATIRNRAGEHNEVAVSDV